MKNVLGILAVVALFAAPALAADPVAAKCDVKLIVESYASVTAPGTITITVSGGGTGGTGAGSFTVDNNYVTTATASILKTGTKGSWDCYITSTPASKVESL
ncbi:MAG: hypothetical protein WCK05_08540, partial [Planctomycetota bacterium]